MPKKNVPINKFEGGIQNRFDRRDVPENALSVLVDVCPDIPGQLRHMGGEITHGELGLDGSILGQLRPGYGLFAFNSDFSVSDNAERRSKLLAVQQGNNIGIYDKNVPLVDQSTGIEYTNLNNDEMQLLPLGVEIKPIFHYIDGELKVCDSNFLNSSLKENLLFSK